MSRSRQLVWLETPSKQTLTVSDVARAAIVAKRVGAILVVDSTFASPALQQPLLLGADMVALAGPSDVVMGAVVTDSRELYTRLKLLQSGLGAVPGPFDCFLDLRGLKTLHLRVAQQSRSAMSMARFLEQQPLVRRVLYPGLPSHPQHRLVSRQMPAGGGGVVTFTLKGGLRESRAVRATAPALCVQSQRLCVTR